MNAEVKVGIFATIGLALLGVAIFFLGDMTLEKQYPLYVSFKDVGGLPSKSIVTISGVEAGKVHNISFDGEKVVVELRMKLGVKVYRDAVFRIGSTSIIGSKFLQIDQGSPSSGVIAAGTKIIGSDTLPLDRMLTSTLSSLQKLLEDVSQNGKMGENLNATLVNVREMTASLNELITGIQPHLQSSMEKVDDMSKKMDDLVAKANVLMDKLNSGQGPVGALIGDPEMKKEVKETITNLKDATSQAKTMLTKFNDFRVYWMYTNRYEPQILSSRSDVDVKIVPRKGRYYKLGLTNIGNTDDNPLRPDYVDKNRIDAQLGWESDTTDFYAGMVKGAGGFGIKYTPMGGRDTFLNRFSLLGEGYDFMRNRTIKGRKFSHPNWNLGAEFRVNRFISFGYMASDIQGTGNTEYMTKITFEDKDIAYLLGLATLGTMRSGGN